MEGMLTQKGVENRKKTNSILVGILYPEMLSTNALQ
jgi:hypothetical protein